MRFDLRTPCKNCPFRTDATAIRFSCRERAEQISESAYRYGFPCHLSADYQDDDEGESDGYVFGENTQHCAGALMLFARHDDGTLPFYYDLSDAEQTKVLERLDWKAPVFEDEDAFLESYPAEDEPLGLEAVLPTVPLTVQAEPKATPNPSHPNHLSSEGAAE